LAGDRSAIFHGVSFNSSIGSVLRNANDHAAGTSPRKMKSRYVVCPLPPILRCVLEG
jgi:hypothetical protein